MHRLVNIRPLNLITNASSGCLGRTITPYSVVIHRPQLSSSAVNFSNNEAAQLPWTILLTKLLNNSKAIETEQQKYLSELNNTEKQLLLNLLNTELLKSSHRELDGQGNLLTTVQSAESEVPSHNGNSIGFFEVTPKLLHQKDNENEGRVSKKDLLTVGIQNALPFIGFGFIDNLIMILAADYIDITLGAALGISTMACAALGNTISDVAGIGSAWYVEQLTRKFGIRRQPRLTIIQINSWQIKWIPNLGRAIGVTIGCLLGMFPLLFLNTNSIKKGNDDSDQQQAEQAKCETLL